MADDVAIRVNSVSKDFILPHERITSVKSLFTGVAKRHKTKETQHALVDISFEIKQGEFFGIVGRNGSGKSTLLKILAGIYQPSKGSIQTQGKLVPFIELGVGFNPELTGRENVYLNGAMLGFSEAEVNAMYPDIVSFAELENFMNQKLKNYSSGMQVRLAFSLATRAKADILLVDEVLAVGDADFQRKCFEYFKKLKKDKTTVVFVSHDMEAVREYCDRAMLIEKNKIVEIGSTAGVAEEYIKLFANEQPTIKSVKTGNQKRWGSGEVEIQTVTAHATETEIIITKTFTAKTDIESPIPGFRIRDGAGKEVTGTNTKIEHVHLGKLKAGQATEIKWQLPNLLSDGEYFVDAAILGADGVTACDWWDEAAVFAVKKPRHLPYTVDPGFTTSVK